MTTHSINQVVQVNLEEALTPEDQSHYPTVSSKMEEYPQSLEI